MVFKASSIVSVVVFLVALIASYGIDEVKALRPRNQAPEFVAKVRSDFLGVPTIFAPKSFNSYTIQSIY